MTSTLWVALALLSVSALLTRTYVHLALRQQWLDHPEARSSHTFSTPTGGGLVMAVILIPVLAYYQAQSWPILLMATALATVGWLDDKYRIAKRWRFGVQAIAACVTMLQLGLPLLSWVLTALLILALVWWVNAFNFMDGIDGLASIQALSICLGLALLGGLQLHHLFTFAVVLGFLSCNWAPARVFMGDSGSLFLGFLLAVWSIQVGQSSWQLAAAVGFLWVPFIADASVTLVARALGGENITTPHKTHVYQLLAQRWSSHSQVSLSLLGLNIIAIMIALLIASLAPAGTAVLTLAFVFFVISIAYLRLRFSLLS